MKTWKVTLEYDGTKYHGWQEQLNARTVQGELRKAVEAAFGCKVDMQGSGRTDSGVHALAQVAHVKCLTAPAGLGDLRFVERKINDELPTDICVLR